MPNKKQRKRRVAKNSRHVLGRLLKSTTKKRNKKK
jgi:hypothetical protein